MNYLVSDLDVEDISQITISYPQGAELDSATFSEAVAFLDCFVDNEEDGDKLRMLRDLQGLKDLLREATAGEVEITISESLLALGSGCFRG
tara:strand:+ start:89 stop:361 length:273 start_codon:yes stop_codon:yes gene_type:complete